MEKTLWLFTTVFQGLSLYKNRGKTINIDTQGINNLDSDGNIIHDVNPVPRQKIIGKPKFCIPYLGYINKIITKPPGAYILIAFTAMMIAVSYLLDERKENKKWKTKEN